MEPVCISGPVMLVLTPLAAVIGAAMGVLYRDTLKARDAQILYLAGELSEANKRLQQAGPLMREAETEVRRGTGRRER